MQVSSSCARKAQDNDRCRNGQCKYLWMAGDEKVLQELAPIHPIERVEFGLTLQSLHEDVEWLTEPAVTKIRKAGFLH